MSRIRFTERSLWPVVTTALLLLITLGAFTGFIRIGSKQDTATNARIVELECQLDSAKHLEHYCIPRKVWERNKAYGAKLPVIE